MSDPHAGNDADGTGVPWESPVLRVVLLSTALAPLGVPLVGPALPAFRRAFGLTDPQASLLVSAYFLAGIVLSPFLGAFADRYGRRRLLAGALAVFALAGAATVAAPSYEAVLAVRVVQGTAAAGLFVATVTLVGDTFAGVQRNAVLGANTAVLSAAAATYPVVGGVLTGVSWRLPFLLYLLALPAALVAWRVLPESPPTERRTDYLSSVARAVTLPGVLAYYAATALTELLLFGAVFTALPFIFAERFALSAVFIGLAITVAEVAATVSAALNGRFARAASDATIVRAGVAAYGVGLLGAWVAGSPVGIAAGVAAAGAGVGLVLPSVDSALSERVPADLRAGALSLRNSVTFLGRAAGPVVFATLAVRYGYDALLQWAGVAALAAAAVATVGAWTLARLSRRTA